MYIIYLFSPKTTHGKGTEFPKCKFTYTYIIHFLNCYFPKK